MRAHAMSGIRFSADGGRLDAGDSPEAEWLRGLATLMLG